MAEGLYSSRRKTKNQKKKKMRKMEDTILSPLLVRDVCVCMYVILFETESGSGYRKTQVGHEESITDGPGLLSVSGKLLQYVFTMFLTLS